MPRWTDGTWISDRQATIRNELLQLTCQLSDPSWSDKDRQAFAKRIDKLRKKIK